MRLKKGDPVIVIAGNEKGKEGVVLALRGDRILVQGINKRKKHQKAGKDKKGGTIVEFEAPVHISNVLYSFSGKGCKLKARVTKDGKKEIYVKTKNEEKVIRTIS